MLRLAVIMSEQAERLQERAMQFAIDVCALLKLLPRDEPGPTVRHQLAKCSTSTAMNYRSSRRARSHAEFTSRIGTVADEADESLGWLEFVDRAKLVATPELQRLLREANDLRNIFAASSGTARHRQRTEFQGNQRCSKSPNRQTLSRAELPSEASNRPQSPNRRITK